jgi:hypothetical protein
MPPRAGDAAAVGPALPRRRGTLVSVWIGRYAIVDGEVVEDGPGLIDRERVREDESVRLLVLCEPSDERSAEFCSEVSEAVATLFGREALSLTGGLLRSLQQAHANLAEWNRRSLREHRVSVGVTCVAVRDGEATVAQVGPALVYVAGPEASPLGGSDEIEPHFSTVQLTREQILVLSSNVENQLDEGALAEVAASGPERALAELFRLTRDLSDVTAALVADLDLAEAQSAPPIELGAPDDQPSPVIDTSSPVERDAPGLAERWFGPRRQLPTLRRPSVSDRPRRASTTVPWPLVGAIGAGVLIVALLIWVIGPSLVSEDREAAIAEAVAAAQMAVQEAFDTPDAAERRAALEEALIFVEQARSLDADPAVVAAISGAAQQELDRLNAVVAVEPLSTRFTFAGVLTAPVQADALAAGGGFLWMLESELGRVFRIDPADTNRADEVYQSDTLYGGVAARAPAVIAWDDAGQRLLILDMAHNLFALTPDGELPAPLPLRDATEIGSAEALTAYLGNLYILDAEAGEVWRYLPGGEGYDSERDSLLGTAELDDPSALAVTGDVYVLDGSRLRRFVRGVETPALLGGLDVPLASPGDVLRDDGRGVLYIVDSGNRRVVVADQTGAFLRQFRHPEFFDLRGIALSEDGSRLYLLTGLSIVSFDPDQEPPAGSLTPS